MYIDTMLLFDLNVTGVHRIKKKHYEQTLYTKPHRQQIVFRMHQKG